VTAVEVLTKVLAAGGKIVHDQEQPRLMVPRGLRPMVEAHRADLRPLVRQSLTLADAYRRYWDLSETELDKAIEAAYRGDITRLEVQGNPALSWWTLRETATAYHAETGRCPFCGKAGPLHLPAEQISLELSPEAEHGPTP